MTADFPKAALERIGGRFPLAEKDPGAYRAFKAGPMKMRLEWYAAEGLGNVCALSGSAMLGLMKMQTLVVNPRALEMPLFSYDYIAAMGRQTLILELYDTMAAPLPEAALAPLAAVKAGVAALPDHDLGRHWYDGMKLPPSLSKRTPKKDAPRLGRAAADYLDAWLALAQGAKPAAPGNRKAADYVDGLFRHGGPSTDAFKKALGEEKARWLFETAVFGTREEA